MLEAMRAVFGAGGGAVVRVFQCIDVAEQLIHPTDPPGTFSALRPTPVLLPNPLVYRAHAAELLARIRAGQDPRLGTRAEVLCSLMRAAAEAPLTRAALVLCEFLWPGVMGCPVPGDAPLAREEWPGQCSEDLAAAQRRLRQDWRRV